MSKLTGFNKDNISLLRIKFQKALDEVASEYGLSAKMGTIRFGGVEFGCKLSVKIDTPEAQTQLIEGYPAGIKEKIGKKIIFNGKVFIVNEYKPRRYKFPISATEVSTGNKFKLPLKAIS